MNKPLTSQEASLKSLLIMRKVLTGLVYGHIRWLLRQNGSDYPAHERMFAFAPFVHRLIELRRIERKLERLCWCPDI